MSFADLRKFRSYQGSSVRDLLRAMRNKVWTTKSFTYFSNRKCNWCIIKTVYIFISCCSNVNAWHVGVTSSCYVKSFVISNSDYLFCPCIWRTCMTYPFTIFILFFYTVSVSTSLLEVPNVWHCKLVQFIVQQSCNKKALFLQ